MKKLLLVIGLATGFLWLDASSEYTDPFDTMANLGDYLTPSIRDTVHRDNFTEMSTKSLTNIFKYAELNPQQRHNLLTELGKRYNLPTEPGQGEKEYHLEYAAKLNKFKEEQEEIAHEEAHKTKKQKLIEKSTKNLERISSLQKRLRKEIETHVNSNSRKIISPITYNTLIREFNNLGLTDQAQELQTARDLSTQAHKLQHKSPHESATTESFNALHDQYNKILASDMLEMNDILRNLIEPTESDNVTELGYDFTPASGR